MPKPIKLISAEAAATLRFLLNGRANEIDRLYPVASPERTRALSKLVHLGHELGIEIERLIVEAREVTK